MVRLDYIVGSCLPLLLFIPGVTLLCLLKRLHYLKGANIVDAILGGVVVWNNVFLIPSIILGVSIGNIVYFFRAFTITSSIVLTISATILVALFIQGKRKKIKMEFKKGPIPISQSLPLSLFFQIFLLLIITLYVLRILINPVFHNWDFLTIYLPNAKGIISSGGLIHNRYFLLIEDIAATRPPLMPLIYAWMLTSIGGYFRLMPLFYLLFLLISVYGVAKEISGGLSGLAAVLFLTLSPGFFVLVTMEGLYLDLPMLTYLMFSLYFLTRLSNKKENNVSVILMFFLLALTLLMLVKEFGIILALSLVAFSGMTLFHKEPFRRNYKRYLVMTTPLTLSSSFLLKNLLYCQTIISGQITLLEENLSVYPHVKELIELFHKITIPSEYGITSVSVLVNAILATVILPSGALLLIIMSILVCVCLSVVGKGEIRLLMREHIKKALPILYISLILLVIWYILGFEYYIWGYRRLTYFLPLISVLIPFSIRNFTTLLLLRDSFKSKEHELYFNDILTFVLAISLLVYTLILNSVTVDYFLKSEILKNITQSSFMHIMINFQVFILLILLTVISYSVLRKVRRYKLLKKIKIISTLSLILLASLLVGTSILSSCKKLNFNLEYYDSLYSHPYSAQYYADVVSFFQHNDKLQGVGILTFRGSWLVTFSEVRVVDLTNICVYQRLMEKGLLYSDREQLYEFLENHNVTYLLIPKPPIAYYHFFKACKLSKISLLNMITSQDYFKLVKEFNGYTLYKLEPRY